MEMFVQTWQFLNAMLGPGAPFYIIGTLGIFLILLVLPTLFKKQDDQFARLPTRRNQRSDTAKGDADAPLRYDNNKGLDLEKFSEYLEPQDEEEL